MGLSSLLERTKLDHKDEEKVRRPSQPPQLPLTLSAGSDRT